MDPLFASSWSTLLFGPAFHVRRLLMASYDASGVMERTLVLSPAGFLADPKIGFLPDFWRRTMVKKLESIGEFGEGRPDFGERKPREDAPAFQRVPPPRAPAGPVHAQLAAHELHVVEVPVGRERRLHVAVLAEGIPHELALSPVCKGGLGFQSFARALSDHEFQIARSRAFTSWTLCNRRIRGIATALHMGKRS